MGHIRIPHGAAQDPYPGCCPYHTTAIAWRAFGCRRPRPKAKRRELPFYGEMEHWLRRQHERSPEGCQWVFFHNSRPVGAQLRGWREACEAAGVPALLFHDLRRAAVRNMRLAGIDQSVRMKISGHKTTSMEARCNILDDADLKEAATKMDSFLKAQKSAKLKRVK
jgi:integrase